MKKELLQLLRFCCGALALFSISRASADAAAGDLYLGSLSEAIIYRVTPAGASSTYVTGPRGNWLALDSRGNLFSSENNSVIEITPAGTPTTLALPLIPAGLAFDADGNLYVADVSSGGAGSGSIFKFTPAGSKTTFATGLNNPQGIGFDQTGNLYVAEANENVITKITPAGVKSTFASGLHFPEGLVVDGDGTVYVADFGTGSIIKISPSGIQTTFATGLTSPVQLAKDRNGNLFVSNTGTREVLRFTSSGVGTVFHSGSAVGGLAIEPLTAPVANISTRGLVKTGDKVMIGGFIVHGNANETFLIRTLGPTLTSFGAAGALQDTFLQLYNSGNTLIAQNDDWATDANAGLIPASQRPPDSRESALYLTLAPGSYTAILSGKNSKTGVGLVEVYDEESSTFSELTNVSTRAFVGTGDNVLIGGFIASGGNGSTQVIVRVLGPTLANFGVMGVLANPTLTLYNANGTALASNDNWKDSQQSEIRSSGYAPPNDLEAAIVITLANGNYTAIVSGYSGGTGVALVEVYNLR